MHPERKTVNLWKGDVLDSFRKLGVVITFA